MLDFHWIAMYFLQAILDIFYSSGSFFTLIIAKLIYLVALLNYLNLHGEGKPLLLPVLAPVLLHHPQAW